MKSEFRSPTAETRMKSDLRNPDPVAALAEEIQEEPDTCNSTPRRHAAKFSTTGGVQLRSSILGLRALSWQRARKPNERAA
jgi:hypothetical protein